VRWLPQDLLMGASDFQVLDVAEGNGLRLYMRTDFHGKVFFVPPDGVLVGSANLTNRGLAIAPEPNYEVSTVLPIDGLATTFVNRMFGGATLVTPELRQHLESALDTGKEEMSHVSDWPLAVRRLLAGGDPEISVDTCFQSDARWVIECRPPSTNCEIHDAILLGVTCNGGAITCSEAQHCLNRCLAVRWLRLELVRRGGTAYFGELSAALHSALSDDPSPRRHHVKELLANLQHWITMVGSPDITTDQPSFSTRFLLKDTTRDSDSSSLQ